MRYQIDTQTIFDTQTGLMWQRHVSTHTYNAAEAQAYAQSLSLAGHTDWRIPTRAELETIFSPHHMPTIDAEVFTDTPKNGWFLCNTPSAAHPVQTWAILFDTGSIDNTRNASASTFFVRCVRFAPEKLDALQHKQTMQTSFTSQRFVVHTHIDGIPETILDQQTGLLWQTEIHELGYTHTQAQHAAQALRLANYTDWRVPTLTELRTLLDDTQTEPSVYTDFVDLCAQGIPTVLTYWTQNTVMQPEWAEQAAWMVDFTSGSLSYADRNEKNYLRAVRRL